MTRRVTLGGTPLPWLDLDIGDNLSQPEPARFRVLARKLTAEEYERIQLAQAAELGGAKMRPVDQARLGTAIRDQVVEIAVLEVANYESVGADGFVTSIRTGAQLVAAVRACVDPGETRVLNQIFDHVVGGSTLSEARAKNSASPSGPSLPAATGSEGGDAVDAGAPTKLGTRGRKRRGGGRGTATA